MNYAAKWNKIDSFIFSCECWFKDFKESITDSDIEEPDVEIMIAAETEHLQKENEFLKRREMPLYLMEEKGRFVCPACRMQVRDANVKYCSNCGQRLIRYIARNRDGIKEFDKIGEFYDRRTKHDK